MDTKKSIIVLGAGGMGAAYASRLFDSGSFEIAFIASGERYQRLNAGGVVINGKHYQIPVLSPEDTGPIADLVIVALKHQHLQSALPLLQDFVGKKTIFVSIMNGLDSEPMIASVYGEDKVLYATAVGIDAQRTGNVVNYSKGGTIFFGEADNSLLSQRVREVQAIFDRAGIPYQTPPDMIRIMWWKFMINVGINQASAILRAPYGVFQASPYAQQIMESAMREVLVIAASKGINLVEADIQEWYAFLNTLDPKGKTSMLQDIEAGRKTEVEIFGGKVLEMGKETGIQTPVNEILFHAIKVIEDQGKGR